MSLLKEVGVNGVFTIRTTDRERPPIETSAGLAKVINGSAGPMIVYPAIEGFFNAGVLKEGDKITLLARKVINPAPYGDPDTGPIVAITLGPHYRPIKNQTIFEPMANSAKLGGKLRLEDIRATSSGNRFGMTAVVPGGDNGWTPYPAFIVNGTGHVPELQSVQILKSLGPGKNMTPMGLESFGKENLWMVRPDFEPHSNTELPDPNNHRIFIIKPGVNGAEIKDVLDFSTHEIPWAMHRIGTASPPHFRQTKDGGLEGLMMIHGMNKSATASGGDYYDYSIGAALIKMSPDGKFEITAVTKLPLIKAGDLSIDGKDMAEQLHPGLRSARYLVGDALVNKTTPGVRKQKTLVLFVSEGDTATIPVEVSFDKLVGHLRSQRKESTVKKG